MKNHLSREIHHHKWERDTILLIMKHVQRLIQPLKQILRQNWHCHIDKDNVRMHFWDQWHKNGLTEQRRCVFNLNRQLIRPEIKCTHKILIFYSTLTHFKHLSCMTMPVTTLRWTLEREQLYGSRMPHKSTNKGVR